MSNLKHLRNVALVLAGTALLAGCASGSPATTAEPALTVDSAPASTAAPASPVETGTPGSGDASGSSLPSPIVAIEYEIDETPFSDDDDDDRTTTDPAHIADLTALLERHGIVRDYESDDRDDCDDWEIDVDAKLENGSEIEIEIETCDPTPFEADLIDLVQTWP